MAREVDLLAGLVWEEVGGAGVSDKGVAVGGGAVGGTVADAGAEGRQAEASLDPPVPPDIGRPHPDRARQFMPFAALRGYYDLVHAKEVVPEPRRPLADDEARALDGIIANLVRGDVVRCRYYEDGGYRVAEGVVSQIDLTFRDLWIVRRRIPFSTIQSLEMLYPAG